MSEQLDVRTSYRAMLKPAYVGEVRVRCWRLPLMTGKELDDPVWQQRCAEYWLRQEAVYGYVVDPERIVVQTDYFPELGLATLTTSAMVVRVLPGDRVAAALTQ